MNEIAILKEKIERVKKDIEKCLAEENSEKKRTTLSDYLDYLKDELKMLESEKAQKN